MIGKSGLLTLQCFFFSAAALGLPSIAQVLDTQVLQRSMNAVAQLQVARDASASSLGAGGGANTSASSSGWVEGLPGMNTCPAGASIPSQDECEALAAMDSYPMTMLNQRFPVSDPNAPAGCSWSWTWTKIFSYNLHPTGTEVPRNIPSCKNSPWTLYKWKCPDGMVSVSPEDCFDMTIDFHYSYEHVSVSLPDVPPGCFGYGGGAMTMENIHARGHWYYNTHPTGSDSNDRTWTVCTRSSTPPPIQDFGGGVDPGLGASTADLPTAAKGDPHMTTISGAKFDIMRAGTHSFLHIPQGAIPADTLLRVEAVVSQEGSKCEDMYIKVLNITGIWAEEKRVGGFSFVTESPASDQIIAAPVGTADWVHLGMLDLKVVRGHTRSGALYLNMFARHLRYTSKTYSIGGILGLDDHSEAATPVGECSKKVLALLSSEDGDAPDSRSVAEVSF